MPHIAGLSTASESEDFKKIILCFDGTGNTFTGSNADTNVVKILRKLDRNHPNQHHYYQTGIGTYDINEKSVNKSAVGKMFSSISQTIDQGFGTTFDAHVMAGYRFLMRYYEHNAKIYIFGFSRGAFTAKFLARMINKVGLLCKGNEEMVPFTFLLYQRFLAGEIQDRVNAQSQCDDNHEDPHGEPAEADPLLAGTAKVHRSHETEEALNEITAFRETFCRTETNECGEETNIKIYFLGIWDCVNSVSVLERKTPVPVAVGGTAQFVRHAVAVDERRVKFKPALLAQDIRDSKHKHDDEDIQEVWFPGNHGDVGGGWPALDNNPLDQNNLEKMTLWQLVKNFWTSRKAQGASGSLDDDRLQMSDIPLAWMIHQVELIGDKDTRAAVHWGRSLDKFKALMDDRDKRKEEAETGFMHDCLAFGYGTGFIKVLMWKFMEWLPFITRWELDGVDPDDKGWKNMRFPLNKAAARDIPRKAVLHASLIERLKDKTYFPSNNHGGSLPPCLKTRADSGEGRITAFTPEEQQPVKDVTSTSSTRKPETNMDVLKSREKDKQDHQTFVITHIQQ
ncbi:hypothetical protein ISF_09612 [Cordyceps fumosorosea ARSEF 2679]|uniref:T6SS Phospholipase effector Tle1-like catalytic domain-containing protein n=1 Tax=Cordyceps fumosorosea (strain ARSEF 2679) TaxID=1081104 RepID=A0A167FCJ3_CORFA|nr:hypothetical protein ISF_09612 [Cordyceps fumosorosea ARSEF 2679]OAA45084.1 hypothetical protein ISF_09612 [Cordyceps fumosorosea ARSEF 2679]